MRKLNRVLSMIVVLLAFAGMSGVRAQEGTGTNQIPPTLPDLKGRKVVIVTSNDYTPFAFKDAKSGKAIGYEYELLGELSRRLNFVVEHQEASFEGMIAAVGQKQYDVGHIGITINDERKKTVDFSEPYVVVEQKLLVRAGEKRFTDSKSFVADAKLRFGAQPGTTSYYSAEAIVGEAAKNTRIVGYDSFALAVTALVNGDVDAVVTDAVSGAGFIGANAGKLQLFDEIIATDPLGFIFPKGSDLVAPFNQALASVKYDGYLKYLENKWFFLYQPPTTK
jgi:polar amino acid transport system substrate-binding protein